MMNLLFMIGIIYFLNVYKDIIYLNLKKNLLLYFYSILHKHEKIKFKC